MRRAVAVAAWVVVLAATAVVGLAGPASAHPLGNFTVNQYSGLRFEPDRVVVDYVEDMAEIPAFQTRRDVDADGDGTVSGPEASAWSGKACGAVATKVSLSVAGKAVTARSEASGVTFPPGAAGLSTLRLVCSLVAEIGEGHGDRAIAYRNANVDDRLGWREITAAGDGTTLVSSSVPAESRSDRLRTYPQDLLSSPLDQRAATVVVRPGGPRLPEEAAANETTASATASASGAKAAPAARGVDRFSRSFTRLVARQHLTVAFGLLAVVLSVLLGAVHAFAPGHGKTVMAAYLVGRKGSYRHAAVIGLTMTATHTAGVLLLGVLLSTSTTLAPESLYPWLGTLSGLLLVAIGIGLLVRRARRVEHDHTHDHTRDHDHELVTVGGGDHGHAHPHSHSHAPMADGVAPFGWRGLMAMGLVGGLVPSPSALVVLLGAIALGRAWFGVALVAGYGIGMAATLLGLGIVLLRAQHRLEGRLAQGRAGWFGRVSRVLPTVAALVIIVVGAVFTVQGVTKIGG